MILPTIKLKHLVLTMLFLIMIVPVFNTSELYYEYSTLKAWKKESIPYFLAITFEFSVFLCIVGGVRAAGIFFALISLVIGLLFHIRFTDIRQVNNWYEHKFIFAVVVQIGISTANFFLAEFYVFLLRKENGFVTWKKILHKIKSATVVKAVIEKAVTELEKLKKILSREVADLEIRVAELKQEENSLQQNIATLIKRKAAHSKGFTVE